MKPIKIRVQTDYKKIPISPHVLRFVKLTIKERIKRRLKWKSEN